MSHFNAKYPTFVRELILSTKMLGKCRTFGTVFVSDVPLWQKMSHLSDRSRCSADIPRSFSPLQVLNHGRMEFTEKTKPPQLCALCGSVFQIFCSNVPLQCQMSHFRTRVNFKHKDAGQLSHFCNGFRFGCPTLAENVPLLERGHCFADAPSFVFPSRRF
jgi:hypothetical protein